MVTKGGDFIPKKKLELDAVLFIHLFIHSKKLNLFIYLFK